MYNVHNVTYMYMYMYIHVRTVSISQKNVNTSTLPYLTLIPYILDCHVHCTMYIYNVHVCVIYLGHDTVDCIMYM